MFQTLQGLQGFFRTLQWLQGLQFVEVELIVIGMIPAPAWHHGHEAFLFQLPEDIADIALTLTGLGGELRDRGPAFTLIVGPIRQGEEGQEGALAMGRTVPY